MTKKSNVPIFTGVATALITPFSGGRVDLSAFRQQILFQLMGGADALVVCGTTGEAPTLTEKEKGALLHTAKKTAGGKIPIIMGIGSADTKTAIRFAKAAAKGGADALLCVTPYYNRGTESGVITHYLHVAEATDLPLILYNVPSRTGVDLSLSQLRELADHPNIRAIKEAGGSIDKAASIRAEIGDRLTLYCGNDSQILPYLSLGGAGVISVLSNLFPEKVRAVCTAFSAGNGKESEEAFLRLFPLCRLLFMQTNPAPVKCAMALLERDSGELRLPLAEVPTEIKEKIAEELKRV